jgi:4-alpha-glucanotransferase
MGEEGPVLGRRRAGILLHPSSLPGPLGNGDLGGQAYRFLDFLSRSAVSVWQTLPLGPTHQDGSPYQCLSVHAGNPLFIDLSWLCDRGWLDALPVARSAPEASALRRAALRRAYAGFCGSASEPQRAELQGFAHAEADWLDDYALYTTLRAEQGGRAWMDWPEALREREPQVLEQARERLAGEIDQVRFEQFLFFRQWQALKATANGRGIALFGDLPIFTAHDSADVWAHCEYFSVDSQGGLETVAGVPPDYFSATGQLWGNPLYRWEALQADGFRWWIQRMRTQLKLFDLVRIDHFRGLQAYWEVPASDLTAEHGHWVEAPGEALLEALYRAFESLPIVAEDLGIITPEVDALRKRFEIPGMKVLQFAFDGGAENPYLPHNHSKDCVVYTGTHDNDTTLGWYGGLSEGQKAHVMDYLGRPADPMPWPIVRAALASVAVLAIAPMQDVLGLGPEQRMNTPGTTSGNWGWRYEEGQLTDALSHRLRHLSTLYGRDGERG